MIGKILRVNLDGDYEAFVTILDEIEVRPGISAVRTSSGLIDPEHSGIRLGKAWFLVRRHMGLGGRLLNSAKVMSIGRVNNGAAVEELLPRMERGEGFDAEILPNTTTVGG